MNSINDLLSDRDDLTGLSINDDISNIQLTPQEETEKTEEKSETNEIDTEKLKSIIYSIKDQLDGLLRTIEGKEIKVAQIKNPEIEHLATGEQIIEGVFNGEQMVGPDGKEYSIPPNYSSKSKLVEGDIMKLTITRNGAFVYKQIGPTERKRIVGELISDSSTGQWSVLADGRTYKILTASVTFFHGKAGDEVVILVPQDGNSSWGAVENIISK